MFGISFSELLLILTAGIIFIGPEKLPELGNKLGKLLRSYRNLKTDFHDKINNPHFEPADKNPSAKKET